MSLSLLLDELLSDYTPSWMAFGHNDWMGKKGRPPTMSTGQLNAMTTYATQHNHVHLFHLAARWYDGPDNKWILLSKAAASGNIPFVHCAWRTAKDYIDSLVAERILSYAAGQGHENVLRMIRKMNMPDVDYHSMAVGAAAGGHVALIVLAQKWGIASHAITMNVVLFEGARNGHEDVCRFAKSQGVTNWPTMLSAAAETGHDHLCRLARQWAEEAESLQ